MLQIEVYNDRFLSLVDPNQEFKKLGDFGGVPEGIIWSEHHQQLTFNSLTNQKTWRIYSDGSVKQLREKTNIANGMAFDSKGNIVVCEQIGYRIGYADNDFSSYEIVADSYNGKPFNSPNDVVVHSDGTILFTDPAFGRRPTRHGRFSSLPQPVQGVYSLDPKTWEVKLVCDDLDTPNGLVFSPDEKKIYFADTGLSEIIAFDYCDGKMSNKKVLAHTLQKGSRRPDGIKIDSLGNIWCDCEGGLQVYDPDGNVLGLIRTPQESCQFCFGGSDMKTIFFGSEFDLLSFRTKIPGIQLRW